MKRFTNKTVLVTGAGSGIGKATALRLDKEGANLIITDINQKQLIETKKLLDVTKQSLYEGIREFKAGNRVGDVGFAIQNYAEKHGYKIMESNDFISNFNNNINEKIFITFDSSELCRGRGGPRCLTLPIYRESTANG